jgi:hypothetical protein
MIKDFIDSYEKENNKFPHTERIGEELVTFGCGLDSKKEIKFLNIEKR